MNKKYLSIISMVFLCTTFEAEAGAKPAITEDQIKYAQEKAQTIAGQMRISISDIDFRKMCKKGSPFSKKTWRANEGTACEDPKIAALAIVHCPQIATDFKTSYCWHKAVTLLGKPSSTIQSIVDNLGNNPPPPTDLPPPLPNQN